MNDNSPTNDPTNAAWEEAMSRDFDARVRDLHEAPLDVDTVKGKAHRIRRNRRAAVAGGILGVAAIVTPIAVLTNGGDNNAKEPDFAPPGQSETPSQGIDIGDIGAVDYLEGRTWHQADDDEITLPKGQYYQAGLWDDQLVTLQPWGEALSKLVIFDENGDVVDSKEDVAGFAVSADESILAYTADGDLYTRWGNAPDGTALMAEEVTDTGGGESVGGAPVSVTGTAPCEPESGACLVRINTYDSGCRGIGSSDVPFPTDALACGDEQDDVLVYTTEFTDRGYPCQGIGQGSERALLWPATCDYDLQDISPDGKYVVGGQIDSDGLGPKEVSVLDVATGEVVSTYSAPTRESFLWSDIAWSASGQLLVSQYDAGQWRLLAIDPASGEAVEVAGPVAGGDVDNPFLLIHH
jgi:hypothetical protein